MYILSRIKRVPQAFLSVLDKQTTQHFILKFFYWTVVVDLVIFSFLFVKFFYNPWEAPFVEVVKAAQIELRVGPATEHLMTQLQDRGLNPVVVDKISRRQFSVEGKMIVLRDDNIQVFEYLDHNTALREASKLVEKYSASSRSAVWKSNMHIHVEDTLVIFYMGDQSSVTSNLNQSTRLFPANK